MKWDTRVLFIFILNLFDGLLTLYALTWGVLEANPVMAWVLSKGPIVFLLFKVVLVGICLVILDKKLIGKRRIILSLLLGVYVLVSLWHVFGAITLYNLYASAFTDVDLLERGDELAPWFFSVCFYS